MRGKGFGDDAEIAGIGITPAYAGKSQHSKTPFLLLWDHPRLCGEKHGARPKYHGKGGSPPPMRGKDAAALAAGHTPRITPAYAGKRSAGAFASAHAKDHPRLCGEKSEPENCDMNNQGSPPPMRGKGQ